MRPLLDRLDGSVADALAQMRLRPHLGGVSAARQLTETLEGLVASKQLTVEQRIEVTSYFEKKGALTDAKSWNELQRRLDMRARSSAQDIRWQGAQPFESKLDATLTAKRQSVAAHV